MIRHRFILCILLFFGTQTHAALTARGQDFYEANYKKINYSTKPEYSSYSGLMTEQRYGSNTLNTLTPTPLDFSSNVNAGKKFFFSGYAAINLSSQEHHTREAEMEADPIIIYRFNNQFQFESLLELQATTQGEKTLSFEYAYLDWFLGPDIALLGGKFMSPIGKFTNTLYLPWLNKLPDAPIGFDDNEAAVIANVGLQLRSHLLLPEAKAFTYTVFLSTGQVASLEDDAYNHISSRGYLQGAGGNKVIGGRLGFIPQPNLEFGFSAARGNIAIFQNGITIDANRSYTVLDTDLNYSKEDLDLRVEYVQQFISANANNPTIPNAAKWSAWYMQAAYQFIPHWESVVRYGYFSTPVAEDKQHQYVFGLNYLFNPTTIFKLAYEVNDGRPGEDSNANALMAQLVLGLA